MSSGSPAPVGLRSMPVLAPARPGRGPRGASPDPTTARRARSLALPSTAGRPLLFLAATAAVFLAVLTALVVAHPIPAPDAALERAVQAADWGPLALAFRFLSWVGAFLNSVIVLAALTALVLLLNRPAWRLLAASLPLATLSSDNTTSKNELASSCRPAPCAIRPRMKEASASSGCATRLPVDANLTEIG